MLAKYDSKVRQELELLLRYTIPIRSNENPLYAVDGIEGVAEELGLGVSGI